MFPNNTKNIIESLLSRYVECLKRERAEPSRAALNERLRLCYRKRISKFASYRRSCCALSSPHLLAIDKVMSSFFYFCASCMYELITEIITPSHSPLDRRGAGSTKDENECPQKKTFLLLLVDEKSFFRFCHTPQETKHRIVRAQSRISRRRAIGGAEEGAKKFLKSSTTTTRRRRRRSEETRPERRKAAHWRREKSLTARIALLSWRVFWRKTRRSDWKCKASSLS